METIAKAYLGLKDFEQAESNAKSAYEKAVGMKYRWAEIKAGSLPKACRDSGFEQENSRAYSRIILNPKSP